MHSTGLTIRKTFQWFLDVDLFIENNTFVLFLWCHWCVLWCCQICSHHIWNFIDGLTKVFFSMLNKSMLKTRIFFYTLTFNLKIYPEAQWGRRLKQICQILRKKYIQGIKYQTNYRYFSSTGSLRNLWTEMQYEYLLQKFHKESL